MSYHSRIELTPDVLELIAERFKALAEPARLRVLNCLRTGEMSVTELVDATNLGQANLSKHLQLLHNLRFVKRRKDGLFVYYSITDKRILKLCEIMCGRIESEAKERAVLLAAGT